jgi:hypothetical protein
MPASSRSAVPEVSRWPRIKGQEEGTYGDYLLNKVGKVFPELRSAVL